MRDKTTYHGEQNRRLPLVPNFSGGHMNLDVAEGPPQLPLESGQIILESRDPVNQHSSPSHDEFNIRSQQYPSIGHHQIPNSLTDIGAHFDSSFSLPLVGVYSYTSLPGQVPYRLSAEEVSAFQTFWSPPFSSETSYFPTQTPLQIPSPLWDQNQRIGQQNASFRAPLDPPVDVHSLTGAGSAQPAQPCAPSSASGSSAQEKQREPTSPSTSDSWVQLTPEGTPPAAVRDTHAGEDGHGHSLAGPSHCPTTKEWVVPKKKKRGRQQTKDSAQGPVKVKARPRRSGPLPESIRLHAAKIKRRGACRFCYVKKATCHTEAGARCCDRCIKLGQDPRAHVLCFRNKITEASLYREQKAPYHLFSRRWTTMDLVDITEWASTDIRTIDISQILLDAPYRLRVRRFIPQPGDMIEEIWHEGGVKRTFAIPPYAIVNMDEAAASIKRMAEKKVSAYINSIVPASSFFWQTYLFAFKQVESAQTLEEQSLLSNAMMLWISCRLASYPEVIVGHDTLGMSQMEDPCSPWKDKIPIPPVLGAQLECIVFSKFLREYSGRVLTQLEELMSLRKKSYWLTIYLSLFVLLHSCSMLIRRDEEYARQINLQEKYANPASIEGLQHGAAILLAHFHSVMNGGLPFSLAAQGRLNGATDLPPGESAFISYTTEEASKRKSDFQTIRARGDLGHDYYWISQLYEDGWDSERLLRPS